MEGINIHHRKFSGKNFTYQILSSLLLIIILLYFISCSNSSTQPPATKDRTTAWNEDIDYLSSQLKAKEFNLFSLISEAAFNSKIKAIKDSINKLQDYEIIFKMQQLIASIGVAHTTIIQSSVKIPLHSLPVGTYYFPDGLYIVTANNQYSNLLEKKVLGINGKNISIVFDSLKTIISHENDYWTKALLPNVFNCVEILKFFRVADTLSKVNLEVEGIGEVAINSLQTGGSGYNLKNIIDGVPTPLYVQNSSLYYWYTYLDTNKTLYLKYNSCQNMPSQTFADFVQEIQNFMNTHSVEKFVVDVRNNSGGNSQVIAPLAFLQSSPLNKKGKLFVIIGRQTFSSALLAAIGFKQLTNCLLIGEPTGGKPNSYGDVLKFTLPNSEIVVQYSTKYFDMMDDNPVALFPDNDVEISLQDYAQGKDPVLDFILNY